MRLMPRSLNQGPNPREDWIAKFVAGVSDTMRAEDRAGIEITVAHARRLDQASPRFDGLAPADRRDTVERGNVALGIYVCLRPWSKAICGQERDHLSTRLVLRFPFKRASEAVAHRCL